MHPGVFLWWGACTLALQSLIHQLQGWIRLVSQTSCCKVEENNTLSGVERQNSSRISI